MLLLSEYSFSCTKQWRVLTVVKRNSCRHLKEEEEEIKQLLSK
jgi:hypothetical protein